MHKSSGYFSRLKTISRNSGTSLYQNRIWVNIPSVKVHAHTHTHMEPLFKHKYWLLPYCDLTLYSKGICLISRLEYLLPRSSVVREKSFIENVSLGSKKTLVCSETFKMNSKCFECIRCKTNPLMVHVLYSKESLIAFKAIRQIQNLKTSFAVFRSREGCRQLEMNST